MTERILVTGAAGFIGSHLVERLLHEGAEIVGVDNFDPFYDPLEKRRNLGTAERHPGFEFIEADCTDLSRVRSLLGDRSLDVVVHLAAKAGVRPSIVHPTAYARANILGTQTMLELSRDCEIDRFVFGSSSSVYGNNDKIPFSEDDPVGHPISPYAATKRAGELLCHAHHHLNGTSLLALRFFTVYGPRQRPDLAIRKFASLMMRGEPIQMFGKGNSERDYTWIEDIVQGISAAIARTGTHPGEFEIINLGESRTTRLKDLVDLIARALDVEPQIERLPMQPGDVERTYADVSKAIKLLDYHPSTPVEEGIPRFVEWLQQNEHSLTPTP